MYPYAHGPYGPRPDANMIAAYQQRHQQLYQQQQQQQRQQAGGQWHSNNGMYHNMDQGSNAQGMAYHNYMNAHYSPVMAYPMQQQQQQYPGQFNAPPNRHMSDDVNGMQPQRPGWAESRPGRTPCKDDWWSHVKEEMQCIDSPKGIDLEAEDEHANVMEELRRTGTTSGVVTDGEDVAAAFDDVRGAAAAAGGGNGDFGIDLDPPFTPTPPTLPPPVAENPMTGAPTNVMMHGGAAAAAGGDGAPGAPWDGQATQPHYPYPDAPLPPQTSPSRAPGADNAETASPMHGAKAGKGRRSSQTEKNEVGGKKEKSRKGKSHHRHRRSSKEGAEGREKDGDDRRVSSPGDPGGLGNSLFLPPAGLAPVTAPVGQKALDGSVNNPRHPFPEKAEAYNKNFGLNGMQNAATAAAAAGRLTSGVGPNGRVSAPPQHLQPLPPSTEPNKSNTGDFNAESVRLDYSVMPAGRKRSSTVENSGVLSDGKRSSASPGDGHSPQPYRFGDNSHPRLSASDSAVDSKNVSRTTNTAVSPNNNSTSRARRRRDQRLYSYMSSRRGTALDDEDENDGDAEEDDRDSSAAYGSDDDVSGSGSSSSGDDDEEDEDDDDSSDSDSDDEAEYSTMHRTSDHGNHPGRSMLEYSAFHDIPGNGLRNEEDSRGDFPVGLNDVVNGQSPQLPRRSGGGYGMGSFSVSEAAVMAAHRQRPSYPNNNNSMVLGGGGASVAFDDKAYMMAEMSLMERTNGPSGLPYPTARTSSAQPHPQGRGFSVALLREDLPQHLASPGKGNSPQAASKDAADGATTHPRKSGDGDVPESTIERLQRIGAGKRVPPKITPKPATASAASSTTASTTGTTTTLPSVQPPPHLQQQQQQPTHPQAPSSLPKTNTDGNSLPAKPEKAEAKLPPARGVEKRPAPSATPVTTRTLSPLDDKKSKPGFSKESTPATTGKTGTSAASSNVTTSTTATTAAAAAAAAPVLAATTTAAMPKKPVAQPVMSSTVEVGRTGSNTAPVPPHQPPAANKRISLFHRMRKSSGAGSAAEKRSASPTNQSLAAAQAAAAAAAAAAANTTATTTPANPQRDASLSAVDKRSSSSKALSDEHKASSGASTLSTATATRAQPTAPLFASGKMAVGSGKSTNSLSLAKPQPLSQMPSPQQQYLAALASDKPPTRTSATPFGVTNVSTTFGSSKCATPALSTPPDSVAANGEKTTNGAVTGTASQGANPSPVLTRPPTVFPSKQPTSPATAGVAGVPPPASAAAKTAPKADADNAANKSVNGTSPTAPKRSGSSRAGDGAGAAPLQLSSNPLSLASSTSTALTGQAGSKRTSETKEATAAPASAAAATSSTTATKTATPAGPSKGREAAPSATPLPPQQPSKTQLSSSKQSASNLKASPGASPSPAALSSSNNNSSGAGARKPSSRPAALSSTDSATVGRVSAAPARRPVAAAINAGTSPTPPPPLSRVRESVNGSPSTAASVATNVGTASVASSTRSEGGLGAVTRRVPPPRTTNTAARQTATTTTTTTAVASPSPAPLRTSASPAPTSSPSPKEVKAVATPAPTIATTAAPGGPSPSPQLNATTTTADDDDDPRDAWMADAYDYYAYDSSGPSDGEGDDGSRNDKAGRTPSTSTPAAAHRGISPVASPPRGAGKRLSTTATSLADIGYIMY